MKIEYFDEPFKHAVIDDFFPPKIFQQILDTAPSYEEISTHLVHFNAQTRIGYDNIKKKFIPKASKSGSDFINPSDLQNIFTYYPEIEDLHYVLHDYFKEIDKEMIDLEKRLRHVDRGFKGYNDALKVYWQRQSAGCAFGCHDENIAKIMSIVIYVSEEENYGTFLYKKHVEKEDESYWNPDKKVEWKQNRAFVFCGYPNLTWHGFAAREGCPRQTIASFYY